MVWISAMEQGSKPHSRQTFLNLYVAFFKLHNQEVL